MKLITIIQDITVEYYIQLNFTLIYIGSVGPSSSTGIHLLCGTELLSRILDLSKQLNLMPIVIKLFLAINGLYYMPSCERTFGYRNSSDFDFVNTNHVVQFDDWIETNESDLRPFLSFDQWVSDLDTQCSIDCEYETLSNAEQMIWDKEDIASARYEEYLDIAEHPYETIHPYIEPLI